MNPGRWLLVALVMAVATVMAAPARTLAPFKSWSPDHPVVVSGTNYWHHRIPEIEATARSQTKQIKPSPKNAVLPPVTAGLQRVTDQPVNFNPLDPEYKKREEEKKRKKNE
ncbi:hypothetical protein CAUPRSCDRAFT_11421 [Caulochytrium protostelioides]|uniref:Uncharacterized protein n=1 Tax=Caulochytrium protostelioides TaxID=1555241 RepID=A0A4P9WW29_9FUNG|nr:hypothetical protein CAUPRSCDRAFT_11421 [Caulochytrium protostelioides]